MFIGFTRFSLYQPGATSWITTRRLADEEYLERLFDPARLDMRADIFFTMSLPQLAQAANNHHLRHVVSFSDRLPEKYKALLVEASEKYDFLILDECADNEQPLGAGDVIRREPDLRAPFQFAEYRLDDDDIVSTNFFDRLNAYIHPSFQGMYVSFSSGITALYVKGELYYARKTLHRLIAIGLAKICRVEQDGSISRPPSVRHSISDTKAPVVLDSRDPAYIWIRHHQQDSVTDSALKGSSEQTLEGLRKRMARNPPASNKSEIRKHFPHVADYIHLASGPGRTSQVLVSHPNEITRRGLSVTFRPVQGRMDLSAEFKTDKAKVRRNILVAFDLRDDYGAPAAPEVWEKRLQEIGVRWSKTNGIGYYRYFETKDGITTTEMSLQWPVGLTLRAIKFVKFRDQTSVVHLQEAILSV